MALGDEWDALDAFLSGDLDDGPGSDEPPDDGMAEPLFLAERVDADQALRKLARLDREADEVRTVADAERQRLKRYEDDRMAGIDRRRDWIVRGLEAFHRALHSAGGPKTLKLPWGTTNLRAPGQPKMVPDDSVSQEGAAVFLLKGHPEWVKVTYDLKVADIKAATVIGPAIEEPVVDVPDGYGARQVLTHEGEVIEGVVYLVKGEDNFKANPGGRPE